MVHIDHDCPQVGEFLRRHGWVEGEGGDELQVGEEEGFREAEEGECAGVAGWGGCCGNGSGGSSGGCLGVGIELGYAEFGEGGEDVGDL